MTGAEPWLSFLRTVPLLAGLDEPTLSRLARSGEPKRVRKGEIVFAEDEAANSAYIVRSGAIAILLATPDGRELVINEMSPGDCFGELALLTGEPRSARAVARDTSELLTIPRAVFLAALDEQPALVQRLLHSTARRLRTSTAREGALAFLDAPARLARVLLELDRQDNERGYVTISQEEIAQRVGVARQTVAKTLGQWRRAGWIVTGRGRIVLLNRAELRRHASE